MDVDEDDELLITKPEVFLYDIPMGKNGPECEHKASDWNIANPFWQGKILIYMAGPSCHIQLDDQDENIYGQAVIEEYPGRTLKPVADSKRYFTLRVQTIDGSVKLVGMGFTQREDSSDVSNILKGYFAANRSWKRKLDKRLLAEAPPKKIVKKSTAETIYAQTNDPDYKYIKKNKQNQGVFQCHECSRQFEASEDIVIHWKDIHSMKKAHECCHCHLPFPFKGERRSHTIKFHVYLFTCTKCSDGFKTAQDFDEHMRKAHPISVVNNSKGKPVEPNKVSSKFKCSRCNMDFPEKTQLIKHFSSLHAKFPEHSSEGNIQSKEMESPEYIYNQTKDPDYIYVEGNFFKCHLCQEKFDSGHKISSHWTDVHQIIARQCDCRLPFPSRTQHINHRDKFHPFKCEACHLSFITESLLEKHHLTSHGCDIFGKKINSLEKLNFKCDYCGENFAFKNQLFRHFKSKHSTVNHEIVGNASLLSEVERGKDTAWMIEEYHAKHSKEKVLKCDVCGEEKANRAHRWQCRQSNELAAKKVEQKESVVNLSVELKSKEEVALAVSGKGNSKNEPAEPKLVLEPTEVAATSNDTEVKNLGQSSEGHAEENSRVALVENNSAGASATEKSSNSPDEKNSNEVFSKSISADVPPEGDPSEDLPRGSLVEEAPLEELPAGNSVDEGAVKGASTEIAN